VGALCTTKSFFLLVTWHDVRKSSEFLPEKKTGVVNKARLLAKTHDVTKTGYM